MEKQLIKRIENSINYIEENLYEKLSIEKIAKNAFMSKSLFYIIFSNIIGTTVKDYIRKRRLSLSAFDLLKSDMSVLDVSIKFQYSTYESYSRAFKKLFGISPRMYRKRNLYINTFPRVALKYNNIKGGNNLIKRDMNKDIIFEKIDNQTSGHILLIDIDLFDQVNKNYGYSIGDNVLNEVPKRIKKVLDNHQINTEVLRIGGDEFALIINEKSSNVVETISKDILKAFSHEFRYDKVSLKVTVSIGISTFSVGFDEDNIINDANNAMLQAKRSGKNQYKLAK